jgi:dihydrodipicolinate synthase/N-acetylneuraminate lyase
MTTGVAVTVTPLRDDGETINRDAACPLFDFYAGSSLKGILRLGTTGERLLLLLVGRREIAERPRELGAGRLLLAIQCRAWAASVIGETDKPPLRLQLLGRHARRVQPYTSFANRAHAVRAVQELFPCQAAVKQVLGTRNVPVRHDVRGQLRTLTAEEGQRLERVLGELPQEAKPSAVGRASHVIF